MICSSGIHQTGALVGCLRKLQYWNLTSILVEVSFFIEIKYLLCQYKSYACHRSTRFGDEQFIELFDVDLVTLPKNLPQWFLEQKQMMEEDRDEEQRKIEQATAGLKL